MSHTFKKDDGIEDLSLLPLKDRKKFLQGHWLPDKQIVKACLHCGELCETYKDHVINCEVSVCCDVGYSYDDEKGDFQEVNADLRYMGES